MTWLTTSLNRDWYVRLLRLPKLEAAALAGVEPRVQSSGLSSRRVVKFELGLTGWLQTVSVNSQYCGDQSSAVAIEDVNDIPAGLILLQLKHVLPGRQNRPFHGNRLGYRDDGFLVQFASLQRWDKVAAHQARGQGSKNRQIVFHNCFPLSFTFGVEASLGPMSVMVRHSPQSFLFTVVKAGLRLNGGS